MAFVKIMKAGGKTKKIKFNEGDTVGDIIQTADLELDNEEIRLNNEVVDKVSEPVSGGDIIVLVNKQKNGL